ncbi:MAG: Hpt domain-containing protein [Gemmatimonadales bacterium]|nr:MAG: Hpt domain-containing protein [Gemmatimonadales bacterium]
MTEPESGGPLLDPAAFVRLREWGGDELLRKMIELFIQNTPARMDQIRTGVTDGDADAIERGAHSLKSSCGNLGAEQTRALAQRMETLGEESRLDEARALLPELDTTYDATLRAMIQARDRNVKEKTE